MLFHSIGHSKIRVFIICLSMCCMAEAKKYHYNWASLKTHPVPAWFDDAKFGIFIHWGAYSVLGYRKGGRGYAEHVPKMIYADPNHYYPYLDKRFGGHPPEFGYKDIIPLFKAEKWDPDAWADLFARAGARYVVLTAEHHDGYALWDSDLTEWCATKIGPMRDLVGDLANAVRARGLKFAPSYHRERHPGFFAKDLYAIESEPRPDVAEEIARFPEAAGLYGPFSYSDEFIADYAARWKELQTKYQPDFMWIDDVPIFYKVPPNPQTKKFLNTFKVMIADYFNAAEKWGKEVYLNNKGKHLNWPDGPGCLEKDNMQLNSIGPKWENPATMGTSYGYMRAEEEKDAYKTPTQLIQLLCDVVSKNGNLLLNIGPRPDGTIPEGMQRRLLAMGTWLKVNGEAVYGSRPWKTFGEGAGKAVLGKGKHILPIRPKELRYTQKHGALYVFCLNRPAGFITLNATAGWSPEDVKSVCLLGSDVPVFWKVTRAGVQIKTPDPLPGEHVWVFKIVTPRAQLH